MRSAGQAVSQRGERQGTVAVVGLGKIGLPLAVYYARHGWRVIGCDANPAVVDGVNAGRSHIHEEPGLEAEVADLVGRGLLTATGATSQAVREADVVVAIVPVIVTPEHQVDFRALDAATHDIGAGLSTGKLVLYETTLPVGTTAQRLRPLLERASQLTAGRDFSLAYSPERVSSGRIFRDLATYPKVVGGIDAASSEAAVAFYQSVLDAPIIQMQSTEDAEFVKLIETTYRDVNIALANEYARYADRRGLDVAAAIAAANTQPYSHIHEPGVGVGGHCIPVYPYFLLHGAAEAEFSLPRSARAINDSMAAYAVERLEAAIGPLAGSGVLILGVAYRGDVREHAFTSAARLREALEARGATVYVDDPLFSAGDLKELGYTPFRPEQAGQIHAAIVQAAHRSYQTFDFSRLTRCQVVLDGRHALSRAPIAAIEALGMRYLYLGDGRFPTGETR